MTLFAKSLCLCLWKGSTRTIVLSGQAGSGEWIWSVCCHLSPYPSPLAQRKPRSANIQPGFLCSMRAAVSSYFAGSQWWCAPGVKPGGGASSSGDIDRKENTWVATGRMQSGF